MPAARPRQALRTLRRADALGLTLPSSPDLTRARAAIAISVAATVAEIDGLDRGGAALLVARDLAEQIDDPALLVKVHSQAAFIAARSGRFDAALEELGAAEQLIAHAEPHEQFAILLNGGNLHMLQRRSGRGAAPLRPCGRAGAGPGPSGRAVQGVAQPRLRRVPRRAAAAGHRRHGRGGRADRGRLAKHLAARPGAGARRGRADQCRGRLAGRRRPDLARRPVRAGPRRDRAGTRPLRADHRRGAGRAPARDERARPVPPPGQRPLAAQRRTAPAAGRSGRRAPGPPAGRSCPPAARRIRPRRCAGAGTHGGADRGRGAPGRRRGGRRGAATLAGLGRSRSGDPITTRLHTDYARARFELATGHRAAARRACPARARRPGELPGALRQHRPRHRRRRARPPARRSRSRAGAGLRPAPSRCSSRPSGPAPSRPGCRPSVRRRTRRPRRCWPTCGRRSRPCATGRTRAPCNGCPRPAATSRHASPPGAGPGRVAASCARSPPSRLRGPSWPMRPSRRSRGSAASCTPSSSRRPGCGWCTSGTLPRSTSWCAGCGPTSTWSRCRRCRRRCATRCRHRWPGRWPGSTGRCSSRCACRDGWSWCRRVCWANCRGVCFPACGACRSSSRRR